MHQIRHIMTFGSGTEPVINAFTWRGVTTRPPTTLKPRSHPNCFFSNYIMADAAVKVISRGSLRLVLSFFHPRLFPKKPRAYVVPAEPYAIEKLPDKSASPFYNASKSNL